MVTTVWKECINFINKWFKEKENIAKRFGNTIVKGLLVAYCLLLMLFVYMSFVRGIEYTISLLTDIKLWVFLGVITVGMLIFRHRLEKEVMKFLNQFDNLVYEKYYVLSTQFDRFVVAIVKVCKVSVNVVSKLVKILIILLITVLGYELLIMTPFNIERLTLTIIFNIVFFGGALVFIKLCEKEIKKQFNEAKNTLNELGIQTTNI